MGAVNGAVLLIAATLTLAIWFVWRIRKTSHNIDQHVDSVANLSDAIRRLEQRPQPAQAVHIFWCDCGKRIEAVGVAAFVDTVRDPRCDDCRKEAAS